jgi:hypothetical protein
MLSVDENTIEVKITFLQPHGPALSFIYCLWSDILKYFSCSNSDESGPKAVHVH